MARKFGTRDDDAELRWDEVQPLGDILADAMQAAAAGADYAVRLNDLCNTGNMLWKRTATDGA